MTATLADRGTLWTTRNHEIRKLAALRVARAALCGCLRCNDSDRIQEMDALIRLSVQRCTDLSNRICLREPPCTRL